MTIQPPSSVKYTSVNQTFVHKLLSHKEDWSVCTHWIWVPVAWYHKTCARCSTKSSEIEQTEVPQHIIVIIAAKYLLHDNIPYRTISIKYIPNKSKLSVCFTNIRSSKRLSSNRYIRMFCGNNLRWGAVRELLLNNTQSTHRLAHETRFSPISIWSHINHHTRACTLLGSGLPCHFSTVHAHCILIFILTNHDPVTWELAFQCAAGLHDHEPTGRSVRYRPEWLGRLISIDSLR